MHEHLEQFLQYARPIWARRHLVLIVSFACCLLGWLVVAFLPNKYEVRATIQVERSSMLEPLLKDITVKTDIASEMAGLMRQTMLIPKSLEAIAEEAGLDKLSHSSFYEIAEKLEREILISPVPGQKGVYTVIFHNSNPRSAQRVVEVLINRFIDSIISEIRADSENTMKVLDQQINEYKAQLEEAAYKINRFKQEHSEILSEEGRSYYARTHDAKRDYEDALLRLNEAEQEVEAIRDQLTKGINPGGAERLESQIENSEKALWELELRFTDQHPYVVAAKRTLEHLKEKQQQLMTDSDKGKSTRGIATQSQASNILLSRAEAKAAAIRSRVNEYRRRWEELEKGVTVMPQLESELASLNRDFSVREDSYQKLVARREAALISERVEKASDLKIKIVEPPRVPIDPIKPNRILFNTLVLLAGCGAGIGLAWLISYLRPIIYTRYDLRSVLDIPILGNISIDKNLVPEESYARYFISVFCLFLLFCILNFLYVMKAGFLAKLAGSLSRFG